MKTHTNIEDRLRYTLSNQVLYIQQLKDCLAKESRSATAAKKGMQRMQNERNAARNEVARLKAEVERYRKEAEDLRVILSIQIKDGECHE